LGQAGTANSGAVPQLRHRNGADTVPDGWHLESDIIWWRLESQTNQSSVRARPSPGHLREPFQPHDYPRDEREPRCSAVGKFAAAAFDD
jgi:hypothetical protein